MIRLAVAAWLALFLASCGNASFQEEGEKKTEERQYSFNIVETQNVFRKIAASATPAVVSIQSYKAVEKPSLNSMLNSGVPFWSALKKYIHSVFVVTYHGTGMGSGFIINKRGYILTNNHVIKDADKIIVQVESKELDARLLGTDPLSDIALIKIKADYRYKVIEMGDSDELEVGEWVLAIGNPYELNKTFTAGVVSALRRDDIGLIGFEDFIQTDAAIHPGNSGGPLVNIKGEVVGINTAIYSNGTGIGFAVPINIAKNILPMLAAEKPVNRGMLGVGISDITEQTSSVLKVGEGALVVSVHNGSPAQRAGIKPGDVIVGFNGEKITRHRQLKKSVISLRAGTKVRVEVIREGRKISVDAILDTFKPGT